jgi:Electron transfer DM13
MRTRSRLLWAALALVIVGGAAGLYWFQPWKLFTDSTVNEALPEVAPTTVPPSSAAAPVPVPQNVLLAKGTLISHEHESSGDVQLIRLADGRVQLTLENLATSDGPDLRVWLTNAPVIEGQAGWHVFDDDRYVELGALKANNGNQVYDVPAGTDLTGLDSVTIWCRRFAVSFAAAALTKV